MVFCVHITQRRNVIIIAGCDMPDSFSTAQTFRDIFYYLSIISPKGIKIKFINQWLGKKITGVFVPLENYKLRVWI